MVLTQKHCSELFTVTVISVCVSQVHYGFVLKTTYNNVTGGAHYMQKGIASMAEGTQDERFFFHLGDALQRQGKVEEAYKVETNRLWILC